MAPFFWYCDGPSGADLFIYSGRSSFSLTELTHNLAIRHADQDVKRLR